MRVLKQDLQSCVDRLNIITRSPKETYTKDREGKFSANIGNYHLDGGWRLNRIVSEGGAVNTPIGSGFDSKRELYNKIQSYLVP